MGRRRGGRRVEGGLFVCFCANRSVLFFSVFFSFFFTGTGSVSHFDSGNKEVKSRHGFAVRRRRALRTNRLGHGRGERYCPSLLHSSFSPLSPLPPPLLRFSASFPHSYTRFGLHSRTFGFVFLSRFLHPSPLSRFFFSSPTKSPSPLPPLHPNPPFHLPLPSLSSFPPVFHCHSAFLGVDLLFLSCSWWCRGHDTTRRGARRSPGQRRLFHLFFGKSYTSTW